MFRMHGKTLRHSSQEKLINFAGKLIRHPEQLPIGHSVTVFVKNNDKWWEHGLINIDKNGRKVVKCCLQSYDFDEVEVYCDTRFSKNTLCY